MDSGLIRDLKNKNIKKGVVKMKTTKTKKVLGLLLSLALFLGLGFGMAGTKVSRAVTPDVPPEELVFGNTISRQYEEYYGINQTWFKFSISESGMVTIHTVMDQDQPIFATVYDSQGDEILTASDRRELTYIAYLNAGDYVLQIHTHERKFKFDLKTEYKPVNETIPENYNNNNDSAISPDKIQPNGKYRFMRAHGDRYDTFKIKVKKNGLYSLHFANTISGLYLKIYDDFNTVDYGQDVSQGSTYKFALPKGEYYLRFESDDKGIYEFTSSFSGLPKTNVRSVKCKGKNTVSVSWTRKAGVDGYQVQASTSSSFGNGKKSAYYTVENSSGTVTSSAFKKKKKVYVRVRTYISIGDKRYYSAWGDAKSVVMKK